MTSGPLVIVIEDIPVFATHAVEKLSQYCEVLSFDTISGAWDCYRLHGSKIAGMVVDGTLLDGGSYEFIFRLKKENYSGVLVAASDNPHANEALMVAGCTTRGGGKLDAPVILLRELGLLV